MREKPFTGGFTRSIDTAVNDPFSSKKSDGAAPLPEKQPKRGKREKKPLSPEEEALRTEAQEYIDANERVITRYAGDTSLTFKLGTAFYIDLEKGNVSMDIRWFKEKGYTKEQILWGILHELEHFNDLKEDPEGMKKNFEYIDEQARVTGVIMLKKWEARFKDSNPELIAKLKTQKLLDPRRPEKGSFNAVELAARKFHHRFWNILDDVYVNHNVRRNAPAYDVQTRGGDQITELYRSKLFPGNDYAQPHKNGDAIPPLHTQLMDKILRDEMVDDEKVKVSPEVTEILARTFKVFGKEFTVQELITKELKPARGRKTKPSLRYFLIKKTIEPLFRELLMKDLEKWNPTEPPEPDKKELEEQNEGDGEGSGDQNPLDANPFSQNYKEFENNSPDQIPEDDIAQWQKNEAEKTEKEAARKAEQEVENKKTPLERQKKIQEKNDAEWCKTHEIAPEILNEYRKIEAEVAPYLHELSDLWRYISGGGGRETRRINQGYFKSGEPDIPYIIQNFPGLVSNKPELVVPSLENARVMRREVAEDLPAQFPEEIEVTLVADQSGSMYLDPERIAALKRVVVLTMSSLREFNHYLDQTRVATGTKLTTDTEIWGIGDEAEKIKPFRKESAGADDLVHMVRVLDKLKRDMGETNDNTAFKSIKKELTEDRIRRIKEGKLLSLVIEITDGGSTNVAATRQSVTELSREGMVTRAIQISETSAEDARKFQEVWNIGRGEPFGKVIGPDLSKLVPAVAALLRQHLGSVRI